MIPDVLDVQVQQACEDALRYSCNILMIHVMYKKPIRIDHYGSGPPTVGCEGEVESRKVWKAALTANTRERQNG